MAMVMALSPSSRGYLDWRSGEQRRVDFGDRHDRPGAMHKAVDAVEAAILRIPKHQPPAALADDEFLRNIAVSKRQRLGKPNRSEEHTSELQSIMRTSYAALCLKTKK